MRRRRETTETPVTTDIPTEYTLDQLFNTHLVWLTDEQKEELKTMKASGQSRTALQEKTMEFFKATTGSSVFTCH
jgi:hypothetical protein